MARFVDDAAPYKLMMRRLSRLGSTAHLLPQYSYTDTVLKLHTRKIAADPNVADHSNQSAAMPSLQRGSRPEPDSAAEVTSIFSGWPIVPNKLPPFTAPPEATSDVVSRKLAVGVQHPHGKHTRREPRN